MSFITTIKRGFKNLFGSGTEPREKQETRVTRRNSKQLQQLEDDLKEGRAGAEAREAQAKKELQQYKEQEESGRKTDIPQYLQDQQEQMMETDWIGGVSIRAIVDKIEDPDKEDIQLISYGETGEFGYLQDIHISKKGTIGLMAVPEPPSERGLDQEADRVSAGNDLAKINASPGGIRNQVNSGYWRLPVTEDRKPITPVEGATVPKLMEIDGEIKSLSSTRENYLENLTEYQQQISQLQSEKEALEKELESVVKMAQEESMEKKIVTQSLDKERTMSEKHIEEGLRAKAQFDTMQSKLMRTTSESQFKEDLVKDMWAEKSTWTREYAKQFDDDELDVAEDKIHRIATMLVSNFDELAEVNTQVAEAQQSQEGETKPPNPSADQQK